MNAAGPAFISTVIETELTTVLLALGDPVRLAIVRELDADGTRACGSFDHLGVGRPTLSHHFKVLREAELIETHAEGQRRLNTLRRDEIDARFPGLLDSVLGAYARREAAAISPSSREHFVRNGAAVLRVVESAGTTTHRGGSLMTWFSGLRPARRRRRTLAGAAVLALIAVGTAAAVTSRATVAPTNSSLPTTGGVNSVGSTLTANPGTWNGTAPITFAYVWEICDGTGAGCHDISGATSQTYTLKADDAGNTVRVRVTATNTDGSASAAARPAPRSPPRRGPGEHGAAVDHRRDHRRAARSPRTTARGPARRRSRSPTRGRSATTTARVATTSRARPPTPTS